MSASKITSNVNTHPETFFSARNNRDKYLFDSSSKDCSQFYRIMMKSFSSNTSATSIKVDRTHLKSNVIPSKPFN